VTDFKLGSNDDQLVDLIGLATYAAKGARDEENLLPRPFRREMFVRRRRAWLAVAALMALAAGLAPIWRLRITAQEARQQTKKVEMTISTLRGLDDRNHSNLTRLADTNRTIAALRKLARARSGWIALLGDLQERFAIAQDVWLDRLQLLPPDRNESPAEPDESRSRSRSNGLPESPGGVRLLIAGSIFDRETLAAGSGTESTAKAGSLLAALRASPLIAAIEREQFSGGQAGLLNFEITLRLAPDAFF
jgi:hypothetical protein